MYYYYISRSESRASGEEMIMRLDYASVLPTTRTAMLGLEKVVHDSGLDPGSRRGTGSPRPGGHLVRDRLFQRAGTGRPGPVRSPHLGPMEIAALTVAITTINAWNRLNVGLRVPAGGYVSTRR